MQKRGELSRLDIILIILISIVLLTLVFFILFRIVNNVKEGNILVEDLDLKISQVKIVDDKTTEITVKRNEGEGEFSGLSFLVDDGSNIEIIKKETSMIQNESETFSLKFIIVNASRIKKIAITPIFEKGNGEEIIGDVEDEYITPNTCSNYCTKGAQCGLNDCGMQCGNGCSKGYLCLNYKCIKQQTSSGGSGGGGGGSSGGSSSEDTNDEEEDENETVCTPTTCAALSKTCGTASDGCGGTLNCGSCSTGYTCQVSNGTCMKDIVIDCGDVTCKSGEYCSNGVCLLDVSGNTYFVATNGNDNNPGTFEQPWYSWQKAFDTANAGDIVYIRGGVWYPTVYVTHDPSSGHGHNGTETNPILFYNYPGEKPILDGMNFTSTRDASGLDIREDTYIKFRGLTIRNVKEKVYDHWIAAIQTYNTGVIYLESMTSHDNGGHGFNFNTYNTLYITNCDSYNNADIMSSEPGNRADGFSGGSGGSDTDLYKVAYYNGCRAWNNSDDGFDIGSSKQVRISNSWSFNNGYLPYGGGVGFKFGPSNIQDPNKRITYNTLAVNNNYDGYTYQNLNDGLVGPVGAFYNNFAYKCNMGFTSDQGSFDCTNGYTQSIHRNNAAYQSTHSSAYDQTYFSLCAYEGPYNASRFIQENNTWIHKTDWPFWEYNPAITVSDSDFVSLDYSQLSLPRKSDGSLPDITFGHLAEGSDLIDAGIIISGHHCSTSGSHSGEDCVEWYGSAPDLGPFESNY